MAAITERTTRGFIGALRRRLEVDLAAGLHAFPV
jgi:hypothetical protein